MPVVGSSHRLASKATGPMDTARLIACRCDRQGPPMAVHQLIPSFVAGDATGQAALHLQLLLRRLGHFGELYAGEVGPGLEVPRAPGLGAAPGPGRPGALPPRHRLAAEQPADAPALPPRASSSTTSAPRASTGAPRWPRRSSRAGPSSPPWRPSWTWPSACRTSTAPSCARPATATCTPCRSSSSPSASPRRTRTRRCCERAVGPRPGGAQR